MCNRYMKKNLRITNQQEISNQHHNEISPLISQYGYHQEEIISIEKKGKTLGPCCWEYKLVQPFWKMVWQALKKLKVELPYVPAAPLLRFISKGNKNRILKRYMHPYLCYTETS